MPNYSTDDEELGQSRDLDIDQEPAVIAAQQEINNGQPVSYAPARPTSSGTPTHVTYYGYEKRGEPDYDSNSAAGIGDRQNHLTPGQSVALSQPERLARFGVTGKSTGLPVQVGGATYYDHDTSPQKFRNIDVFSPQGPGRNFKVWGHENDAPVTDASQQYPYDPNKDPLSDSQQFTPPASPPPSWNDLTSSQEWQGLSPEDKGKVTDQWYSQSFNYAGSLGNFQSDDRQKLYDFYKDARKQATYTPPLDLGKTANNAISQVYGTVLKDVHKQQEGNFYQEGQQKSLDQDDTFRQARDTIQNSPDLSDAQKQQGIQAIEEQWKAKQAQIGQYQQDEHKYAAQAQKDYDLNDQFSQTNIGKGATQAGHLISQVLPMVPGILTGGPLGTALTGLGGVLSGSSGYMDNRDEALKILKAKSPDMPQEEMVAKANSVADAAEKGNMTVLGVMALLPGNFFGLKGFAAKAGITSQVGGVGMAANQYLTNKAFQQVDPNRSDFEGVPGAWKFGTTMGALTHTAAEIPGAVLNQGLNTGDIGAKRTAETTAPETAQQAQPVEVRPEAQAQSEAAPTPEAAKPANEQPDTKTEGTEPWVSAIANRYAQERSAQGEIGEIAPGEGYSRTDLREVGLNMKPEEINQQVSDLMNNVGDPKLQAAAVTAEEARLSQRSSQLSRIAEDNPSNTQAQMEAENSFKDLTDFHNGPVAQLKNNWHAQGMTLQGEAPIDLGSYNGLREAWLKDVGTPPPAGAEPVLRRTASKVRDAVDAENGAMDRLGQRIDGVNAKMSAEDVRNNIMTRMGEIPCVTL